MALSSNKNEFNISFNDTSPTSPIRLELQPLDNKTNDHDALDMSRMGKTQSMHRIFRQVSLLSFTAVLMGTWEWMLLANTQGLTDGGTAGLFWSYIWVSAGFGLTVASLAEMASMAPTAAGQVCEMRMGGLEDVRS